MKCKGCVKEGVYDLYASRLTGVHALQPIKSRCQFLECIDGMMDAHQRMRETFGPLLP